MSSLIVLLPSQPAGTATEFEYLLSPDGRTVGQHASAQAAVLPLPSGATAEVVAIAPAAAVSWHQVELPKGTTAGSPRLRAVLEGLLEDRLLDEPESLHFALQPHAKPGAPVWVAVCDRAWLRSAVQVLEAAGRPATRIVPEFAPEGAPALYALGDPQQPLLVACGDGGVTVLPLTPSVVHLLPAAPEQAERYAEPAVAGLAEQALQQPLELQQAPQRWLQAMRSRWDLAQLDFASSGQARAMKKFSAGGAELWRAPQWRPVRWGAVLLVAIHLVGLNAWAWKERTSLQAKRVAIARTLTQTFPQVKVVVDAPVQMEKEVAALRQLTGAASGRDLESMLGALASAAPPERPVTAVDFNGQELRVKSYRPDEASSIAMNLKSQGYSSVAQGETVVISPEATR